MIDPRTPNFSSTPISEDRARFAYAADPAAAGLPPAATIITPYFNTGPIFRETARSVLGQSLQQFEWIIVNDCSTDPQALAVLDEYRELARTDHRIRIIDHRVNHGLSAARNTGFREARTPYVFMLDSDDLVEPTTLEKCAWFLECNPSFSFAKGKTVGFAGQQYLWDRGFHDRADILKENIVTATTMVRKSVHREVGGFDETIRGGLEDWEFWLRCADRGLWGGTIPEYLDWYRRRAEPTDAWANLACSKRRDDFCATLQRKFPRLFTHEFPRVDRDWHMPHADVPMDIPWANPLDKKARRALWIVPWFRLGGADKFNLDAGRMLTSRGWELTIATTLAGHPWAPEFTRLTPDVFMLDHLAQMPQYPRMLRYLIASRKPDVVVISNSELAYLILPYLRAHCPGPVYVDYSHMEEEYWKNGGHPRHAAGLQDQLDLNIVSSHHLRNWMASRGANPDRVEVCYTNVDTQAWRPEPKLREDTREELGVDADTTLLLYPVRLTAQKQPMVFADSIRRLRDRLAAESASASPDAPSTAPRFLAVVAGDGEDRPALERYIDQHNLSAHIRLLGSVPIGRMPGLYNACDILFLPSMQEGIALSIYETMSCGKVVVGAIVGGQRELVIDGCGFLFPLQADKAAEAEAYAAQLAELIQNPDQRLAIGAAARQRVSTHFTLHEMGERLVELFDLAAHHKRTRPRQTLSQGLAQELAVAGIDWIRTRDLCEYLWPYRAEALQRREADVVWADQRRAAAATAVSWIESSTGWKLVQAARILSLRGREIPHLDDPEARLEHIRRSASYRLMMSLKRLPPISVVSRLRHGSDAHRTVPDVLRYD